MAKSKKSKAVALTEMPTEADIRWARKHGWDWNSKTKTFTPEPVVSVIVNPMAHRAAGWTPWLQSVGALQMDAPFGDVRAALRVAESIRQQRRLGLDEMSCAEEA